MKKESLLLFIIFICISAVNCQDGSTCVNEIVRDSIKYCKNSTSFDENNCNNLECYIACVEDYYGNCSAVDQFFYLDAVVFRVQERARCNDILYHDNAFAACNTTEITCSTKKAATMQQLLDESFFNFFMGEFDVYKTVTCRVYPLMEDCISAVPIGDCNEDMASYVNAFKTVGHRISSCGHAQNTTLFDQFDGNVTCSGGVTTEHISTMETDITVDDSTTVISESTSVSPSSSAGVTSTSPRDETTLNPHEHTSTQETRGGTSELTNIMSTSLSRANVSSSINGDSTSISTAFITTTPEPTQQTQRNIIGGRDVGDYCTLPTVATDMQDKGCQWPLKFLEFLPDNYCDGLECHLACFEESVGTCDREDFRLNKIANRIHGRFVCDYLASGRLDNRTGNEYCEVSRCFTTLAFAIKNVLDHTNYCKLFDSMRTCSVYVTTEECTSEINYYDTQYIMLGYDFCSPENSPLYEQYGHPPVATGCKYGGRASTLHPFSVMLWWWCLIVLIGTRLV